MNAVNKQKIFRLTVCVLLVITLVVIGFFVKAVYDSADDSLAPTDAQVVAEIALADKYGQQDHRVVQTSRYGKCAVVQFSIGDAAWLEEANSNWEVKRIGTDFDVDAIRGYSPCKE